MENSGGLMAVFVTVGIAAGSLAELAPLYTVSAGPQPMASVTPYTPLELAGRDIYLREGCYNCHSQMVRPFRSETLRYGPWSRAGEVIYDRPFQLGSRRIGPDLARIGGKYPDAWHYEHMLNPREMTTGSVMPAYPWLLEDTYTVADIQASVEAMKTLGVPYTEDQVAGVKASVDDQASGIVSRLAEKNITTEPDREIVALIAYLQRVGSDAKEELMVKDGLAAGGGQ